MMESCHANAAGLTSAAASERFEAEGVPYAMILSPDELTRDPHALAVGLFEYQSHHVVGRVRLPRHPAQFASTPASLASGSPMLGEHTDEILAGSRLDQPHRGPSFGRRGAVSPGDGSTAQCFLRVRVLLDDRGSRLDHHPHVRFRHDGVVAERETSYLSFNAKIAPTTYSVS